MLIMPGLKQHMLIALVRCRLIAFLAPATRAATVSIGALKAIVPLLPIVLSQKHLKEAAVA
jgi:hypothetical protein